ncbi:hypothetical protein MH1LPH_26360 [Lactiplantibacillus brownii]
MNLYIWYKSPVHLTTVIIGVKLISNEVEGWHYGNFIDGGAASSRARTVKTI